jgi:leucine-rich repeat protein SHOC2
MAPSKRRKTSDVAGNASAGVQTRRSASARGDPPDAPDADLDAEPEELMCPITRTVFRDPVFVVDSGHTYERSAILSHFDRNGAKDPLTRRALSSTKVMTNWAMRNVVQDWLDKHPGVTPDGWDSRELLEPSKDDGTRSFDDEGDVGVLRTWRAMCPELQERWPEAARPEHWEGVTMENGRVVQLKLEEFGLTGAVPAEIGRLSALRELDLDGNELTSVPAEIGQLTSLEKLYLGDNQLTSLPAEIGQLTALEELYLEGNQLTSLPAEIGQLASLEILDIRKNQLTSVLAEIGQLTALERLHLDGNRLTSVPANIGQLTLLKELYLFNNELTSLPAEIGQLTALEELRLGGNLLMSVPVEIGQLTSLETLFLYNNKLTSVPAEIGQLTSLRELDLSGNRLTSVPANIGQLTALKQLNLSFNKLTRLPAAIRDLRAAGCLVVLDDGVRVDE